MPLQARVFDFRGRFRHSALMETDASALGLQANAPRKGQKNVFLSIEVT
jgi:hypothetical protein